MRLSGVALLASVQQYLAPHWSDSLCVNTQITLMEMDDYPDPKGNLRKGIFEFNGRNVPPPPEDEDEMLEEQPVAMDAEGSDLPDVPEEDYCPMQIRMQFILKNTGMWLQGCKRHPAATVLVVHPSLCARGSTTATVLQEFRPEGWCGTNIVVQSRLSCRE